VGPGYVPVRGLDGALQVVHSRHELICVRAPFGELHRHVLELCQHVLDRLQSRLDVLHHGLAIVQRGLLAQMLNFDAWGQHQLPIKGLVFTWKTPRTAQQRRVKAIVSLTYPPSTFPRLQGCQISLSRCEG
jgi:hypothetical protein